MDALGLDKRTSDISCSHLRPYQSESAQHSHLLSIKQSTGDVGLLGCYAGKRRLPTRTGHRLLLQRWSSACRRQQSGSFSGTLCIFCQMLGNRICLRDASSRRIYNQSAWRSVCPAQCWCEIEINTTAVVLRSSVLLPFWLSSQRPVLVMFPKHCRVLQLWSRLAWARAKAFHKGKGELRKLFCPGWCCLSQQIRRGQHAPARHTGNHENAHGRPSSRNGNAPLWHSDVRCITPAISRGGHLDSFFFLRICELDSCLNNLGASNTENDDTPNLGWLLCVAAG